MSGAKSREEVSSVFTRENRAVELESVKQEGSLTEAFVQEIPAESISRGNVFEMHPHGGVIPPLLSEPFVEEQQLWGE